MALDPTWYRITNTNGPGVDITVVKPNKDFSTIEAVKAMEPGLYLFSGLSRFPNYLNGVNGKKYSSLFISGPVTVFDIVPWPEYPDFIVRYIIVPSIGMYFQIFPDRDQLIGSPVPIPVESDS